MNKLIFQHSYIYEKLLSDIDKQKYQLKDFFAAEKFTIDYAKHWKKYNSNFFLHSKKLGLKFPEFWVVYFLRP